MYIPKRLKVVKLKDKGRSLFSNKDMKKGDIVIRFHFDSIKSKAQASSESVQIDDDKFLDSKYYCASDFINHSCNPTTRINFNSMNFTALRDIKKKEEITYNYLASEFDLVADNLDFECKCHSKNCIGRVKGFSYLNKKQKIKLKPLLSPFLRKKIP